MPTPATAARLSHPHLPRQQHLQQRPTPTPPAAAASSVAISRPPPPTYRRHSLTLTWSPRQLSCLHPRRLLPILSLSSHRQQRQQLAMAATISSRLLPPSLHPLPAPLPPPTNPQPSNNDHANHQPKHNSSHQPATPHAPHPHHTTTTAITRPHQLMTTHHHHQHSPKPNYKPKQKHTATG